MAAIYLNTAPIIALDMVDLKAQVFKVEITADDLPDSPTFGEVENDEVQWKIAFTATQDPTTGTVFDYVMEHAGEEVEVVYAPFGNEEPSESQPHYGMTAKVKVPRGTVLGGEATKDRNRAQIELEWDLNSKPTKITEVDS